MVAYDLRACTGNTWALFSEALAFVLTARKTPGREVGSRASTGTVRNGGTGSFILSRAQGNLSRNYGGSTGAFLGAR